MQNEKNIRVIAEGGVRALKEMRGVLAAAGVEAELMRPPDSNVNK